MNRWHRFGLLDLMLLISAVAVSSRLCLVVMRHAPLIGFLAAAFVAVLLFGPIVLVSQYLRGRRDWPSAGEWFWITPVFGPVLVGIDVVLGMPLNTTFLWLMLIVWLCVLLMEGLFGGWLLRMTNDGRREAPRCGWTDRMGFVSAFLFVPGAIVTFVLAMNALIADW